MKRTFPVLSLLTFWFTLLTISVNGGSVTGIADPHEKTFITNPRQLPDKEYQSALMQQNFWQRFSSEHSTWRVMFNENSAMVHRAFGRPIAVGGADARLVADNFIQSEISDFNIPVSQLQFRSSVSNSKYHYVNFLQYYQGLEVLFTNVQIRMTHDYRVNQFALDCYPSISVQVAPAFSSSSAANYATAGLAGIQNVTVTPALKILPVPGNRDYKFHLVYEVTVATKNDLGIPARYYTLVDAANGEVLYRANQIHHVCSHGNNPTPSNASANTDVNVKGTLHLTHPYDPATVEPMKNLKIVQNGITYFTDNTGYVGLPASAPSNATFFMEGRWVRVRTNSVTPTWVVSLNPGVNDVNIDSSSNNIKERTTYNAINTIHGYMKSKYPSFTGLDFPLQANIDVAGTCNAFYDGSSVNFFNTGGGCNATSLVVDVCYHEYGHGINDRFYQAIGFQFSNGAMNEGYADLWALGITGSPVLGIGFFDNNPNGYVRRYDINKKVYPQNLIGQVHNDGEIIAGSFWDTGVLLGNLQQMMDLFKETLYAGIAGPNGSEGTLYPDILLETLAQDDNDGDLSNGSPNFCIINAAFEMHGVTIGLGSQFCTPVANFSFQPSAVCAGSSVTFSDQSFFPDGWNWSFPGGTPATSFDQNPQVTYNAPGVYDVTLTVSNGAGTNSITKTGVVTIYPANGQYALPYSESFESISFPGNEWAIDNGGGSTWTQNTLAAKTGSNSIFIDNFSGNTLGSSDVFLTPTYDLSWSTGNSMTFELAFAATQANSDDRLRVYATTNCGQLWNLRYVKTGAQLQTAGVVSGPFTPSAGDWVTQTVNLNSISYNNKPSVGFKFEYIHDLGNNIFIDDINITGTTGLSDLPSLANWNVYPNPVSETATVGFILSETHEVFIDVIDVMGREVKRIEPSRLPAGEYQFDLPLSISNGLYSVRVFVDGIPSVKKVVVEK
jgi:PKD repeat protein